MLSVKSLVIISEKYCFNNNRLPSAISWRQLQDSCVHALLWTYFVFVKQWSETDTRHCCCSQQWNVSNIRVVSTMTSKRLLQSSEAANNPLQLFLRRWFDYCSADKDIAHFLMIALHIWLTNLGLAPHSDAWDAGCTKQAMKELTRVKFLLISNRVFQTKLLVTHCNLIKNKLFWCLDV